MCVPSAQTYAMHHAIPSDMVRFRGILLRKDTQKKTQRKNEVEKYSLMISAKLKKVKAYFLRTCCGYPDFNPKYNVLLCRDWVS